MLFYKLEPIKVAKQTSPNKNSSHIPTEDIIIPNKSSLKFHIILGNNETCFYYRHSHMFDQLVLGNIKTRKKVMIV